MPREVDTVGFGARPTDPHSDPGSLLQRTLALYRVLLALVASVLCAVLLIVWLHQSWQDFALALLPHLMAASLIFLIVFVLIDLFQQSPFDELKRSIRGLPGEVATYPSQVRNLSEQAVEGLIERILAERCSDDIARATTKALRPILHIGRHDRLFRSDLDYEVRMERRTTGPWSPGADGYLVETRLASRRHIPTGRPWVSFARTADALAGEFADELCLARELVEVSPEAWGRLLEAGALSARVRCGTGPERAAEQTIQRSADVVRFEFPPLASAAAERLSVATRFWMPDTVRFFPVRFMNYFCVGTTEVSFRISDPHVVSVDAFVSYAGDTALNPTLEHSHCEADEGGVWRCIVGTFGDAVLWPGSGVVFVWRGGGPQSSVRQA
jgi:hypothetical protein